MTKHPLTENDCNLIAPHYPCNSVDIANMRATADWQLEQVVIWLKNELACSTYLQSKGYYDCEIDVDDVLDDLKEAMRPREGNNG